MKNPTTTKKRNPEDDELEAAAQRFTAALLKKVRAEALTISVAEFSRDHLPPGVNQVRAFYNRCRSGKVAGAIKTDAGWICTRAAWLASFPQPRERFRLIETKSEPSESDLVEQALAGVSNLRPTKAG